MENKKIWDVLTLTGNAKHIEIISSYICNQSLGSHSIDNKELYYFDNNQKEIINNILNKHVPSFDVDFFWDIQDEEQWHLNWKDNFTPIKINQDLIIIPDWDNHSYNFNKIIKIKPGMAFGTGHHETTFLMLKHLINNLNQDESVLDLGSGSGILSIVSHFYGAKKVTAVEFDLDCKDNFIQNMEINDIKMDAIDLIMENVLCFEDFNYNIILANIHKNVIKELIPKFKNSKSMILLSGILEEDKTEILLLLELNKMKLIFEDQYNEWLLMGIRNA